MKGSSGILIPFLECYLGSDPLPRLRGRVREGVIEITAKIN
jgi:hypothetical protein